MIPNRIHLSKDHDVLSVQVTSETELPRAVQALELTAPAPVLVLVGGAGGVDDHSASLINKITDYISQVVAETQTIIVDGGTQSGVMASMGQSRTKGEYQFPLVGVAVDKLVSIQGGKRTLMSFLQRGNRAPLDPYHTHFILVPGANWGDESIWISQVATVLSRDYPSVTVLINGGEISREDVMNSLDAGRPVIVMGGTGRLADELANNPPPSPLVRIIQGENKKSVQTIIHEILSSQ